MNVIMLGVMVYWGYSTGGIWGLLCFPLMMLAMIFFRQVRPPPAFFCVQSWRRPPPPPPPPPPELDVVRPGRRADWPELLVPADHDAGGDRLVR